MKRAAPGSVRVWRIRTLKERFRLYVDEDVVRCDPDCSFLGLRVLSLHYKIAARPVA